MTTMASKHPELVASVGAFDTYPFNVNCRNGIIDLKTGVLIEHSASDLVMKLAPVDYNPDAKCRTFDRFLLGIFEDDRELIEWTQRAIGYTLTGKTNEQLFFIAYTHLRPENLVAKLDADP